MKQYKIEIWCEDEEKPKMFFRRPQEKVIFQIILDEKEIDLRAVLQKIVEGGKHD